MQVLFDAAAGAQDVVATNSIGPGVAFASNVLASAPALYFDGLGGIALRQDLTLVRPDAAARAGELIGLIATGLGATDPELATGQFAPAAPLASTRQTLTATIGGRAATVAASFALPAMLASTSVVVMVPAGLPAESAMTQIRVGTAASNNVLIPVR